MLVPDDVPPANFLTSCTKSPVSESPSPVVENAEERYPYADVITVPDGAFSQSPVKLRLLELTILVPLLDICVLPKFNVPIFLYYTITHAPSSVIVEPNVTGPAFNAFRPVPI